MFLTFDILVSLLLQSLARAFLPGLFQASEQNGGIPWWVWLLIILVLLVLLWWWLRRRPEETAAPTATIEPATPASPAEAPAAVEAPVPPVPDDLTRIEGIGPKIASVLQAAGITTFAELAATDVSRLEQILREADIRLGDPSTWPEQASLASAGEWDALQALQDELKGGRRV